MGENYLDERIQGIESRLFRNIIIAVKEGNICFANAMTLPLPEKPEKYKPK